MCCWAESNDGYLDHVRESHDFSVYILAWAIQNGVSQQCIKRYLIDHNGPKSAQSLCHSPILYFAAERNSPQIVRMLCRAGAKPSQNMVIYDSIPRIPLLPYTILSAESKLVDTTQTVIALLAMGASPYQVPEDMWQDYVKAPTKHRPRQLADSDRHGTWCTTDVREALCRTFNLIQRYSFWNAARIGRPSVREIQVARANNMLPLFEMPYYLFGQQVATTQVLQRITSHLLFNAQKPLVLLFTGPSGHGKTELARGLGILLSLETFVVDCTTMRHGTDMFGPWHSKVGSEVGSALNNHLAKCNGKRTVVFLDHFDRAKDDARQAMLVLFESGRYTDRRNQNKIDCSKVFWFLAANTGTEVITNFWRSKLEGRSQEQKRQAPISTLQVALKQRVIQTFGATLAGRFSTIVPFLPFDKNERAVIAYKFMRELWYDMRKPINTGGKQFAGTLFLTFVNDGQIAEHIAQRYDLRIGARSLARAVDEEIRDKVAAVFLARKPEVNDRWNTHPLRNYNVRVVYGSSGHAHMEVTRAGARSVEGVSA